MKAWMFAGLAESKAARCRTMASSGRSSLEDTTPSAGVRIHSTVSNHSLMKSGPSWCMARLGMALATRLAKCQGSTANHTTPFRSSGKCTSMIACRACWWVLRLSTVMTLWRDAAGPRYRKCPFSLRSKESRTPAKFAALSYPVNIGGCRMKPYRPTTWLCRELLATESCLWPVRPCLHCPHRLPPLNPRRCRCVCLHLHPAHLQALPRPDHAVRSLAQLWPCAVATGPRRAPGSKMQRSSPC